MPRTPFSVKDRSLRYVSANAALIELAAANNSVEFLGKKSAEFFNKPRGQDHDALDRQVLKTGAPIRDSLEYWEPISGAPTWLLVNRWPVADNDNGEVAGVAALSRVLVFAQRHQAIYERLQGVIDYVRENFSAPIDVANLAARAEVSVSQLERDFVTLFGMPPRRYVTKVRFEAALDLLRSGRPVTEVAHACGYADQSAFTRRFRASIGMSPSEYRRSIIGRDDTGGVYASGV